MNQPRGIFEVTQDIEHVYGEYFVRAIVAAPDEPSALQSTLDTVANHRDEWENAGEEPPFIEAARLTARRIGLALDDAKPGEIFAIVYGSDTDEP